MAITILIFSLSIFAQEDKAVAITCNGTGTTLEEARKVALRSAIEQAFGAFISSNTEILNDKVVSDQIISVTNGTIQSYESLSESQFPDGRWGTTIKANVSVGKLTSFVQSKGVNVEIKGGLFAINIKQQMLNEQGEEFAVLEMVKILHEQFQNSFDYTLETGTPKAIDQENKNWTIPMKVEAKCNKNMEFCEDYFAKTIKALSLSPSDVNVYRDLKKIIYPIILKNNVKNDTFYLRNRNSIFLLYTLNEQWESFVRGYTVSSGDSIINYVGKKFTVDIKRMVDITNFVYIFDFLKTNSIAGTITWNEERTLSQIESMTGFSVKPLGIRSHYRKEGIVIYEDVTGHGILASWPVPSFVDYFLFSKDPSRPYGAISEETRTGGSYGWTSRSNYFDTGDYMEEEMINKIDTLNIRGYDDWRIPTLNELKIIYDAAMNYGLPYLIDIDLLVGEKIKVSKRETQIKKSLLILQYDRDSERLPDGKVIIYFKFKPFENMYCENCHYVKRCVACEDKRVVIPFRSF
jgi:hypothetical protein